MVSFEIEPGAARTVMPNRLGFPCSMIETLDSKHGVIY